MPDTANLICPVCQKSLSKINNSLSCKSGHSFDIAARGYVNLLLSQDKNSRDPGDNKDMARARKRFLDTGYYRPLASRLSTIARELLSKKEECCFLDAGCGDGYYTHTIKEAVHEDTPNCSFYGLDISKEAIRLAAGRDKSITFMVASLFKIPFSDQGADIILNAFAPASDSEFSRILKKDGSLITVIPGRKHLIQLKEILYDKPYENDEKEPDLPSFKLEEQVRISNTVEIGSHEDLSDLVVMTPYYWRTPREGLERVNKLTSLTVTTEFIINIHSLA